MRTEQLPWDSVPGPHYAARELKPRKKWVTVGGWILVAVLLLGGLATRYRVLLVFSALYALALLTKKDVVVTSRGLEIIAIFKIKAYSRMNGTNLHSPVELQPEMHAESHLEEHPMSLL